MRRPSCVRALATMARWSICLNPNTTVTRSPVESCVSTISAGTWWPMPATRDSETPACNCHGHLDSDTATRCGRWSRPADRAHARGGHRDAPPGAAGRCIRRCPADLGLGADADDRTDVRRCDEPAGRLEP